MQHYVLERDEMGPLEFDGELLAVVDTDGQQRSPDGVVPKDHYTELAVYRVQATESPVRWVVQSIGHTRIDGESTRYRAVSCETPEEVGKALMMKDKRQGGMVRLFGPGYTVLDLAADRDEELDAWLDEYVIGTKEVIR